MPLPIPSQGAPRRVKAPERSPQPVAAEPPAREDSESLPDGWLRDSTTGKTYKKMPGMDVETLKGLQRSRVKSLTVEQLLRMVPEDDDFDLDNLNSSAETFLAHLRVPPDREEQERLKRERIIRRRAQEAEYQQELSQEEENG